MNRTEIETLRKENAALRKEVDLLERVAVFYGDEANYPAYYAAPPSKVLRDGGWLARQVWTNVIMVRAVREAVRDVIRDMPAWAPIWRTR